MASMISHICPKLGMSSSRAAAQANIKKPWQSRAATQNAAIEIALSAGECIFEICEKDTRDRHSQDCKTQSAPPIFTHLLPDSLRIALFSDILRVLAVSFISIPQQRWT
jgi:hypothetical protein